jgi:hypothetical protein
MVIIFSSFSASHCNEMACLVYRDSYTYQKLYVIKHVAGEQVPNFEARLRLINFWFGKRACTLDNVTSHKNTQSDQPQWEQQVS